MRNRAVNEVVGAGRFGANVEPVDSRKTDLLKALCTFLKPL